MLPIGNQSRPVGRTPPLGRYRVQNQQRSGQPMRGKLRLGLRLRSCRLRSNASRSLGLMPVLQPIAANIPIQPSVTLAGPGSRWKSAARTHRFS